MSHSLKNTKTSDKFYKLFNSERIFIVAYCGLWDSDPVLTGKTLLLTSSLALVLSTCSTSELFYNVGEGLIVMKP